MVFRKHALTHGKKKIELRDIRTVDLAKEAKYFEIEIRSFLADCNRERNLVKMPILMKVTPIFIKYYKNNLNAKNFDRQVYEKLTLV